MRFFFFSAIIKILKFLKKYVEQLTFLTEFPLLDDQEHYKNLSKIKLLHFEIFLFFFDKREYLDCFEYLTIPSSVCSPPIPHTPGYYRKESYRSGLKMLAREIS